MPTSAPYGSWRSPLSATALATSAIGLHSVRTPGGLLHWVESRPAEQGRNVLMRRTADGRIEELSPPTLNVRTRVHEYGGVAWCAVGDRLLASHDADQRLYAWRAGEVPQPLTPPGYRYADGAACADGRQVFLVREDHTGSGEARNAVVVLDPDTGGAGTVLYEHADFVAWPRPSADGQRLAWVSWNHPNMPWDTTSLNVGDLRADGVADVRVIAGGDAESVLEPRWDAAGHLYFLSDRSGFWNLYRWDGLQVQAITHFEADLGGALWQLGQSTWTLTGDGHALVRVTHEALDRLAVVELASGAVRTLQLPYASFDDLALLQPGVAVAIAQAVDALPVLLALDLATGEATDVRSAGTLPLPAAFVSHPRALHFPTAPGPDGAPRDAHAWFLPPCHPDTVGPADALPPLMVLLHGGPTAHSAPVLRAAHQFWTTRGFAVAVVNYGGSTGFGRAYRERMLGQWGVVDLADAVACVDHLVQAGAVDGARVVIRGGSAGGYTVLAALAFSDRFRAGINYFGIADLEALAAETHKFESRYTDRLIAPLPEGRDIYRARSPLHHLDRMNAALITFQGSEDKAVPPAQSRTITAAVRARGQPVAYLEFEGEQHGFRQAGNVTRALEAEQYFLGRVLGFTPADAVAAIVIDNLPPQP